MSKPHEAPLLVTLQPSKRLTRLLALLFVIAVSACFSTALPVLSQVLLSASASAYFCYVSVQIKKQRYTIKHSQTTGWLLSINHHDEAVKILPSTVITRVAIFLQLSYVSKQQRWQQPKTLLICHDALSENDYRQLIVRLKTSFVKLT